MYYLVYKTTNLINGKIYVGIHQTEDLDDDYLGSGVNLGYSIRKYGRNNFNKEILYECDNEQDMINKEKEIVTKEFIERPDTYNVDLGGNGGHAKSEEIRRKMSKSHPNTSGKNNPMYGIRGEDNPNYGSHRSEETRRKMSKSKIGSRHTEETKRKISASNKGKIPWNKNKINCFSKETRKKMSESTKEYYKTHDSPTKGKQMTNETKKKMSESSKGIYHSETTKRKLSEINKGKNNPNYGKKWIYNEQLEINKIVKDPQRWVDQGWALGMKRFKEKK